MESETMLQYYNVMIALLAVFVACIAIMMALYFKAEYGRAVRIADNNTEVANESLLNWSQSNRKLNNRLDEITRDYDFLHQALALDPLAKEIYLDLISQRK